MKNLSGCFFIIYLSIHLFFIGASEVAAVGKGFRLKSPSFKNKQDIAVKHAYSTVTGGKNVSVALNWTKPPTGTKSLAILMYDKHEVARNWVHWLIIDIPPTTKKIRQGVSGAKKIPKGSTELVNSYGTVGYGGPAPPVGSGKHTYDITLYALKIKGLDLSGEVGRKEFLAAVRGKVIKKKTIVGYYERK